MTEGEDSVLNRFQAALEGTSVDDIVALRQELFQRMNQILNDPATLSQVEQRDVWNAETNTFEKSNFFPQQELATSIANAIAFQEDELAKRGFDPFGVALPPGSSAQEQAQGNLNARFGELAERRRSNLETERLRGEELAEVERQFGESRELEEARQAESQRETNIGAALDLNEAGIRRGELKRAEAHDRMQAAAESAQVQARTVEAFGGRNLPPGTEFFPNLGPDSAVAAAAQAAGFPFRPFETGGTFGLNPAASAAPITQAVAGSAGSDVANTAAAQVAAALAGLGLPNPGAA